MPTLLTSKQSVKESYRPIREIRRTEQRQRPGRWPIRAALLLLLAGGLATLVIIHNVVAPLFAPNPASTTCTGLMSEVDYPQEVNLQAQDQTMSAVQLVNDLTEGSPAALVQVTHHDPQNRLDVYIFGCALAHNHPQLTQLFTQQGLVQGAVEITPQHTLITKMVDTRLSAGMIPFLQPLQQNVYHEYTWRQGTFVQLPFEGFYPVTSHAEANALQQSANSGHQFPWSDPVSTALQMSKDLLQWLDPPQTQLISRQGDTATVMLTRENPHIALLVTLRQLVQPGSTGLWFVTDARTRGMLLTNPGTLDQPLSTSLSSPIHFSGANVLIDGKSSASLFDHTLAPVNHATNVPMTVHPDSSYTGTLTYANLASGQQGIILIESLPTSQNQAKESGQILLRGIILG